MAGTTKRFIFFFFLSSRFLASPFSSILIAFRRFLSWFAKTYLYFFFSLFVAMLNTVYEPHNITANYKPSAQRKAVYIQNAAPSLAPRPCFTHSQQRPWSQPATACRNYEIGSIINPLSTKLYLSDIKTQFVPRSKHFSSRL